MHRRPRGGDGLGEKESESPHLHGESGSPADRSFLNGLLRRFSLTADKRLGQHFLVSQRAVDAIVARTVACQGILEIGPGAGALTCSLPQDATIVAIELDTRMAEVLEHVAPHARVVQANVLETDVFSLVKELPEPRCIVSNMPYNITGPLLGKVSECRSLIRNAVLMMQREVGDRILSGPGKPERGALSVAMQLQFTVSKVCDVPAGAFHPPPKVDSVVLDLVPHVDVPGLEETLALVKKGFTQPRKTLANNLSSGTDRLHIEETLVALGYDTRVRPHQLSNEQWIELSQALKEKE